MALWGTPLKSWTHLGSVVNFWLKIPSQFPLQSAKNPEALCLVSVTEFKVASGFESRNNFLPTTIRIIELMIFNLSWNACQDFNFPEIFSISVLTTSIPLTSNMPCSLADWLIYKNHSLIWAPHQQYLKGEMGVIYLFLLKYDPYNLTYFTPVVCEKLRSFCVYSLVYFDIWSNEAKMRWWFISYDHHILVLLFRHEWSLPTSHQLYMKNRDFFYSSVPKMMMMIYLLRLHPSLYILTYNIP